MCYNYIVHMQRISKKCFFFGAAVAILLGLVGCARSPHAKEAKFLARGKALMEKKDYIRAILEIKNAVRAMPNDAEPYYRLGLAYLASGSVPGAYAAFRKATELNPNHSAAQMQLAG